MNYKEALQEIINLYNSGLPLNKNTVKRCQQALEQSGPRMYEIQYGDGLKTKIEVSDSGIKVIAAVDSAKNNGYFEKFSILPESSNPIATDHTTIQPNNE